MGQEGKALSTVHEGHKSAQGTAWFTVWLIANCSERLMFILKLLPNACDSYIIAFISSFTIEIKIRFVLMTVHNEGSFSCIQEKKQLNGVYSFLGQFVCMFCLHLYFLYCVQ